mgnify:FL=1
MGTNISGNEQLLMSLQNKIQENKQNVSNLETKIDKNKGDLKSAETASMATADRVSGVQSEINEIKAQMNNANKIEDEVDRRTALKDFEVKLSDLNNMEAELKAQKEKQDAQVSEFQKQDSTLNADKTSKIAEGKALTAEEESLKAKIEAEKAEAEAKAKQEAEAKEKAANEVKAKIANVISSDEAQGNTKYSDEEISKMIYDAAEKYGVDPKLVASVCKQETHFTQEKSGSSGKGMMQLTTISLKDMYAREKIYDKELKPLLDKYGDVNGLKKAIINDASVNVEVSTALLKAKLKGAKGNVRIALQNYNGSGAKVKYAGEVIRKYKEDYGSEPQNMKFTNTKTKRQ